MNDNKVGISDAIKAKTEPKRFQKNPIPGTKFSIAISSAKVEWENQHSQQILLWP